MPKKPTFPTEIHVARETPQNEDPYLIVINSDLSATEDGQEVAVYQFVRSGRAKVTRTLNAT